jgi:DNA-binding NarL/FixJ family response regulator
MTRRRSRRPAERTTDREVGVVSAVLVAGSKKAAARRLGLSHSTVKHHLANAQTKVGTERTAQLMWLRARQPNTTPAIRGVHVSSLPSTSCLSWRVCGLELL